MVSFYNTEPKKAAILANNRFTSHFYVYLKGVAWAAALKIVLANSTFKPSK